MSAVPDDLMQDYREVDLACDTCGECWTVTVPDSEDVTQDQAECPVAGCDGDGVEV